MGTRNMTEREWLECTDPENMWICRKLWISRKNKPSDRKIRLFACACCRRIWDLLTDERSRKAVEVAEKYADGLVSEKELTIAAGDARAAAIEDRAFDADAVAAPEHAALYTIGVFGVDGVMLTMEPSFDAVNAAFNSAAAKANRANLEVFEEGIWKSVLSIEKEAQSKFFRDIFGNPFRPVKLDLTWLTPTVVKLAQQIYEDRAYDRLLLLADVLEEAGCDNTEILNHCRGPEPHVRGCWVVDPLLGKA